MSRKVVWSLSLIVIVTLMLTACGAPPPLHPKPSRPRPRLPLLPTRPGR